MVVAEGALELLPFLFRRLDISAVAAGDAASQPQEVEMDDDEAQALAEALKALAEAAGLTPEQVRALSGLVLAHFTFLAGALEMSKAHPARG